MSPSKRKKDDKVFGVGGANERVYELRVRVVGLEWVTRSLELGHSVGDDIVDGGGEVGHVRGVETSHTDSGRARHVDVVLLRQHPHLLRCWFPIQKNRENTRSRPTENEQEKE